MADNRKAHQQQPDGNKGGPQPSDRQLNTPRPLGSDPSSALVSRQNMADGDEPRSRDDQSGRPMQRRASQPGNRAPGVKNAKRKTLDGRGEVAQLREGQQQQRSPRFQPEMSSHPEGVRHQDIQEQFFRSIYQILRTEFWTRYSNPPNAAESKHNLSSFNILQVLGEGSFGKVLLVESKRKPVQYHALKVMNKAHLVYQHQVRHAFDEKRLLHAVRHPNAVNLEFVFKDNGHLFIGMPFVNGGDFFTHLCDRNTLDENATKIFGAQIMLALEYLHLQNVAYRDLKPENILMDYAGYLKVTDFGFAKIVSTRTWTLCGTPEYLAPEIVQRKGYSKAVDWWAFGVLLYEILVGVTPFYHKDSTRMYSKICTGNVAYPRRLSKSVVNLLSRLLRVEPTRRAGNLYNGSKDIKYHPWFGNVDWIQVYSRKADPPFRPILTGPVDTHYFDSVPYKPLERFPHDRYAEEFKDF